jgi:hypothetical protein
MSKVHRNSLRKRFIAFIDDRFYCDGKDYWIGRLDELIIEYNRLMTIPEFRDDPQYRTNTVAEWYVMMQAIYNVRYREEKSGTEHIQYTSTTVARDTTGFFSLRNLVEFTESLRLHLIHLVVLIIMAVVLVCTGVVSYISVISAFLVMVCVHYFLIYWINRR